MTFTRGDNGMLGFTINEVGVVVKVDGMAKNTGLTVNSRLLQVRYTACSLHVKLHFPP